MEKGKIKKFQISSDYYVIKAVNNEMEGEIMEALKNVKRALSISDDVYLRLKSAAYYELMEMYELANNIYFGLLAEKGDIMHCYYALSDNMFAVSDESAGLYYLNKYTHLAQSAEAKEEAASLVYNHMTELRRRGFRLVPEWAQSAADPNLQRGNELADRNDFAGAEKAYAMVPEGSMDYLDAKNSQSLCLFFLERDAEAEAAAETVLREEPDNVIALCNLVKIYEGTGKRKQKKLCLDRLLELEISDFPAKRRACIAFAESGLDAAACRLMEEYLVNNPYDTEIMQLLGIGYYNLSRFAESARSFENIVIANDMHHIARFYKNLAAAKRDGEIGAEKLPDRLSYRQQVPEWEAELRLKKLKQFINRMTQVNSAEIWATKEFTDVLTWSFSLEDDEMNYYLVRDLAAFRCPARDAFFDEVLLNCYVNPSVKRHVIYYLSTEGRKSKLHCVFDNILKEIKLNKNLEELPEVFRVAYGMAVSTLASLSAKFERVLSRVLTQSSARYLADGKEIKKANALAAALVYGMKLGTGLNDVRDLAELFGCKPETLTGYIKRLGLGEKLG